MKKGLVFLMLLSATSVFSQDVIVKKDGTTILSKVIEIGFSEVKYKKFSNQDGPTYTILKSELQTINYENGEKETFGVTEAPVQQQEFNYNNQVNNQLAEGIAAGNRMQRENLLASAKAWHTAGEVWFWVNFLATMGIGYLVYDEDDKTPAYIAIGAGFVWTGAGYLIFNNISDNKRKAANAITAAHLYKRDFKLGDGNLSAGIDLINDNRSREQALGLGVSINF